MYLQKVTRLCFWQDEWSDGLLKDKFSELFSFVRKPKCSIRFQREKDTAVAFFLPLSPQASAQLEAMQALFQDFSWDMNSEDHWKYIWGSTTYSSSKAYRLLIGQQQTSPLFKCMWTSGNLGKHKFFFLLLLMDRLNTRNMLRRKNRRLDDYNCVLCSTNTEETCFHLFFTCPFITCPFSAACWNSINISWNTNLEHLDMVCQARISFGSKIFRELVITACWVIWTTRNGVIFDGKAHSLNQWKRAFKDELGRFVSRPRRRLEMYLLGGVRFSSNVSFSLFFGL